LGQCNALTYMTNAAVDIRTAEWNRRILCDSGLDRGNVCCEESPGRIQGRCSASRDLFGDRIPEEDCQQEEPVGATRETIAAASCAGCG
jgi:hypothetical protein